MFNNLFSRTVSASGIILPEDPPVTPARPRRGWGGRLHAVHGNATTAGLLDFYDGADNTGTLILSLPVAAGWVEFAPYGSHRFIEGVYVEFNGAAGDFAVTFA